MQAVLKTWNTNRNMKRLVYCVRQRCSSLVFLFGERVEMLDFAFNIRSTPTFYISIWIWTMEANYSSSTGWKSQLGTGIRSLNYNFGSVPRAEISPCNYPLNVSRCDCRFTTLHSCCYRRLPATWSFLRHFVVDPRQSFVLNGLLK